MLSPHERGRGPHQGGAVQTKDIRFSPINQGGNYDPDSSGRSTIILSPVNSSDSNSSCK